ncbi:response regulator [bacterium]|nr:response regulator [bacterium]
MHFHRLQLRIILELILAIMLSTIVALYFLPMVAVGIQETYQILLSIAVVLLLVAPFAVFRLLSIRTYQSTEPSESSDIGSSDVVRPMLLILVIGVGLTGIIAYWLGQEARRKAKDEFDVLADRVKTEVSRRMTAFEHGLKSLRGLHEASEVLTLDEFRDYCHVVDPVECFPGAMGQGFIRNVQSKDLNSFLAWAKENLGSNFHVRSVGDVAQRQDYFVICHIEPLANNKAAWGLDIGSEANRRTAAEKARATGLPTLSAKIDLVQDQHNHNGFLYLLAVYDQSLPLTTAQQRETAFKGWVYMPITSELALEGIVEAGDGMVNVDVYDDTAIDDPSAKLFSSRGFDATLARKQPQPKALFTKAYDLTFGGRRWAVRISSSSSFDTSPIFIHPFIAILVGGTLTIVLSFMVWNIGSARLRAVKLAESMTGDLMKAKEEAEEGMQRFTTIFEGVPVGLNVLDENGKVIDTNPAGLKLWEARSADQVKGMSLLDQVAWEARQDVVKGLCDALMGRPSCTEFEMMGLRGTWRRIELHSVVAQNTGGEGESSVAVLNVLRDVTQQRKTEAELNDSRTKAEESNRIKSEFLANMSHEIRTPMTAILGYTDLLAERLKEIDGDPEQLEFIQTIRRNGEHLLAIINDILDLSKIEAGKMTVEMVPMRVGDLIREVMDLMEVKAAAKGLPLDTIFETKIPMVINSDPIRMRQILVNLVGNAIKFTEIGRVRLRVSFVDSDKSLRLSVEDSGIGMTQGQINNLFQAFVQADNSTARRFGGTGLGLRISKRLAEMLGGDISVTSEPGTGSVFCLSVEIKEELDGNWISPQNAQSKPEKKMEEKKAKSLSAGLLKGMKVLLAEDGPDNVRLISFHLRKAGAEVSTVENGKLAIEKLTVDGTVEGNLQYPPPFDVLLTDMQMPVMDGYEEARLLREKGCQLPIIALTAHAMAGDADKCLEAGCTAYTTKPIDRTRLIELVQKYHPNARESSTI